ncbi:MAG: hypothetical protein AAGA90_23810 [Actinomycetota bacterium]
MAVRIAVGRVVVAVVVAAVASACSSGSAEETAEAPTSTPTTTSTVPTTAPIAAGPVDVRVPDSFEMLTPMLTFEPVADDVTTTSVEPNFDPSAFPCPSGSTPRVVRDGWVAENGVAQVPADAVPEGVLRSSVMFQRLADVDVAAVLAQFGSGRCEVRPWLDEDLEPIDEVTSVDAELDLVGPADRPWVAVSMTPTPESPSRTITAVLVVGGDTDVVLVRTHVDVGAVTREEAVALAGQILQTVLDEY